VARQNNEDASDVARTQFDSKAVPHNFLPHQLVLLDKHSFLHKKPKLAPKWSGPHKIIRLKGDANVEIQLRHNNRKTVVHANRLKLILLHSPTLRSTRIISPARNHLLNNLRKIMSTPGLRTTTITRNKFYCPASWRLPILHLPLQLINHRKQKFPLVDVLKIRQLLLLSRNQFYLTNVLAHTLGRIYTVHPRQNTHLHATGHVSAAACFARGEGLEVDNKTNEGITVNCVNADNSWTLVQRRKKKKVKRDSQEEKWNAQQRENFLRFGDIYKGGAL
jgi:hypothetical protein